MRLREAVWANPSDLEACRVYADWLLAKGNSQGEYINLRLAATPSPEQERQAAALLKRDRAKWLGDARPFVRAWTNDRVGFVATATCEAQQLIDGYLHVVGLGPRLRLTVTSLKKKKKATVAALCKLALGRFHGLSLSPGLDDQDLAALAPSLAGVRHLELDHNDFTGAGLRAIGAHVAGIRTLSVVSHTFHPDWVDAVIGTPGFASLECVELRAHAADPDAAALERLRAMPAMKRVNPPRFRNQSVPMDPGEG